MLPTASQNEAEQNEGEMDPAGIFRDVLVKSVSDSLGPLSDLRSNLKQ